jgi:hypothetical protein
MSAIARRPEADPLYAAPAPERASYATGMLLDAQDFADEQTYHRGRLARALGFLAGSGTLAGLEVTHRPATADRPEEIEVAPGVAVDGLGRMIEIQRNACLRLERWFEVETARDDGDTLRMAALEDVERFLSERAQDGAALPERAVVADVYLRFVACERGLTPSFAAGPFDALDAVAASRVRDAYELHLVPRTDGLDDDFNGLPDPGPDLAAIADIDERRAALQDALLDAYPPRGRSGSTDPIAAPAGHPRNLDPTAVFLARVLIPVGATDPPQRTAAAVLVDNYSRRFVPAAVLLARWIGA